MRDHNDVRGTNLNDLRSGVLRHSPHVGGADGVVFGGQQRPRGNRLPGCGGSRLDKSYQRRGALDRSHYRRRVGWKVSRENVPETGWIDVALPAERACCWRTASVDQCLDVGMIHRGIGDNRSAIRVSDDNYRATHEVENTRDI